jgi:hypothetical protein
MRLTNRSIGAAGRGLVQGEVQLASFQSGSPLSRTRLKGKPLIRSTVASLAPAKDPKSGDFGYIPKILMPNAEQR